MMDPIVIREPKIPKPFQFFFDLVGAGKARRLCDITDPLLQKQLLEFIPTCFDFYDVEDIIEVVAAQYADAPTEIYLGALKDAIAGIWPPEQPQVVLDIQKGFCNLCVNNNATGTWLDYQVALQLYPDEIQRQFQLLSYEDRQKVIAAFEAINIDLNTPLPSAGRNLGQALGKLRGIFNKTIGEGWPRRMQPKPVKSSAMRGDDATALMEEHFVYQAICDLLDGNFTNLDPVIGDEACEARPSSLIDIWYVIDAACEKETTSRNRIHSLKFCYILRHIQDPESPQIRDKWQIKTESLCSKEFMIWCDGVLEIAGPWARDYLKYCKANTLASTMAADEWGIASYDRNKGIYKPEERTLRRRELSCRSTRRICDLATTVLLKCPSENGQKFWGQTVSVLSGVHAYKQEKGSDLRIEALPIFETMRTVLAYELLKNRPIILSLYRIKYVSGDVNPYSLIAVHTIVYAPVDGKFVKVGENHIKDDVPCLSLMAFQFVNPDQAIMTPDGADFFARDNDDYITNFEFCDFALQAMIYSAVHPPLPHGGFINDQEVGPDCGRNVLQLMQKTCCTESWNSENVTSRNGEISLLDPACNLFEEYNMLLELGNLCGLANKQYMTRPGGGVVCVRTIESCAFTIHHINMQSLKQVRDRDGRAMIVGALKQFHNFDVKKSYSSQDDAEAGK